jgi:hypothetical protein
MAVDEIVHRRPVRVLNSLYFVLALTKFLTILVAVTFAKIILTIIQIIPPLKRRFVNKIVELASRRGTGEFTVEKANSLFTTECFFHVLRTHYSDAMRDAEVGQAAPNTRVYSPLEQRWRRLLEVASPDRYTVLIFGNCS